MLACTQAPLVFPSDPTAIVDPKAFPVLILIKGPFPVTVALYQNLKVYVVFAKTGIPVESFAVVKF